jgi:spore coat polysaccharide biosynthesis protein SpsF (cytidylyltransferase family)
MRKRDYGMKSKQLSKKKIGPLMENNLALYRIGDMRDSVKENYLLCATINDEDLPWDTTQIEW